MNSDQIQKLASTFVVEHVDTKRGRVRVLVRDAAGNVLSDSVSYPADEAASPWRGGTVASEAERCARYGAACELASQARLARDRGSVH